MGWSSTTPIGLQINGGPGTWILVSVVVWLATMLATLMLPALIIDRKIRKVRAAERMTNHRQQRRNTMGRQLILAAVAVLALGACSSGGGDTPPDLAGRAFISSGVEGHTLVPDSSIRMAFEADTVSVQAGCNTLFGGATWDDGKLTITDQLASTMMACSDELMAQDTWLSEYLTSGPELALDGETLVVTGDDATITLVEE